MKAMRGRKFQIDIGNESHTLWHGFDKAAGEQLLGRRTMLVHKTIKEHFVANGLGDIAAPWKWWKDNIHDYDNEAGVVFVKTRASQEAPLTTHDITKKTDNVKLGLRT